KVLKPEHKPEAKDRILQAAGRLFSEKGYEGTRVYEIADAAGVNKALIYYYFHNKEDILDSLIDSLMTGVYQIALEFVDNCVRAMVQDGRLSIAGDRFLFAHGEALKYFKRQLNRYYADIIDYVLENRRVVRIAMLESLKGGKHKGSLFRIMQLLDSGPENSLHSSLKAAAQDVNYHEDLVFFEFFFVIIPLVSMAAFYDDYKEKSLLSDERLKELALSSYATLAEGLGARHIALAPQED
ncbi:MAG: TetR family transcriptional regulator, partial [Limnochordia bacterium]|nr:TetR/AcrR family transcriptional regulator [Bacillota bacterium]